MVTLCVLWAEKVTIGLTSKIKASDLTLNLIILENPEEPRSHEAKLPLTCIRERGNHLSHGGLPSNAGQTIVVREQEPRKNIERRQYGKQII